MEDEKNSLSDEQRNKIYRAIGRAMSPDDRLPSEVISDDYGGDEDSYLRTMAGWLNVKIY